MSLKRSTLAISFKFPGNFIFYVAALPLEETQKNSNLIIATTRTGGHIGFMEGFFPFRKTWIDRLLVQFVAMVFEHDAL